MSAWSFAPSPSNATPKTNSCEDTEPPPGKKRKKRWGGGRRGREKESSTLAEAWAAKCPALAVVDMSDARRCCDVRQTVSRHRSSQESSTRPFPDDGSSRFFAASPSPTIGSPRKKRTRATGSALQRGVDRSSWRRSAGGQPAALPPPPPPPPPPPLSIAALELDEPAVLPRPPAHPPRAPACCCSGTPARRDVDDRPHRQASPPSASATTLRTLLVILTVVVALAMVAIAIAELVLVLVLDEVKGDVEACGASMSPRRGMRRSAFSSTFFSSSLSWLRASIFLVRSKRRVRSR